MNEKAPISTNNNNSHFNTMKSTPYWNCIKFPDLKCLKKKKRVKPKHAGLHWIVKRFILFIAHHFRVRDDDYYLFIYAPFILSPIEYLHQQRQAYWKVLPKSIEQLNYRQIQEWTPQVKWQSFKTSVFLWKGNF